MGVPFGARRYRDSGGPMQSPGASLGISPGCTTAFLVLLGRSTRAEVVAARHARPDPRHAPGRRERAGPPGPADRLGGLGAPGEPVLPLGPEPRGRLRLELAREPEVAVAVELAVVVRHRAVARLDLDERVAADEAVG